MTIEELHIELKSLGVSEDQYYLHGLFGSTNDDEKIGLTIKRGKFNLEYEVYYRERGEKHSSQLFHDEDEACTYVLNKFKS